MQCHPIAFCIEVATLIFKGCYSSVDKSILDINNVAVGCIHTLRRARTTVVAFGPTQPTYNGTLTIGRIFFFL